MSFTSIMSSLESESKKGEWFDLKEGISNIRIISNPVTFRQKFFKKLKKSEICYEGCGYAQGSSTKLLCYIIDNKDARNKDGSLKVQLFKMGWSVFEAITGKEKIRKEMGLPEFEFPMKEDIVVLREGKDLNTNYTVEITPENSNYSPKEIEEALKGKDSCEVILDTWKKTTKERHEKEGKPEEEKAEELPTVQLDEEEVDKLERARTKTLSPEEQEEIAKLKDIPF